MEFLTQGLLALTWKQLVMYAVGGLLIWLAVKKEMEPALLLPMGFGAILVNIPMSGVIDQTMAGAGQVGAALAIYLKARKVKNLRMQQTIIGALPAGVLGVGEPLIYGVTLPMGKPFITAGLGAGFGGAFVMLMHVQAIAWGPSGLVAIPLMRTPSMMLYFFLGILIAYIMGFIITWFGIKAEDVANV